MWRYSELTPRQKTVVDKLRVGYSLSDFGGLALRKSGDTITVSPETFASLQRRGVIRWAEPHLYGLNERDAT